MSLKIISVLEKGTAVSGLLTLPLSRKLALVVGAFTFVLGLLLTVASVAALRTAFEAKPVSRNASFGAAAFFGLPAMLFAIAGLRLLIFKPNAYQSLFRPLAWYLLCAVFLIVSVAALTLFFVAPAPSLVSTALGLVSALFLALLCYGAGTEAARKGKNAA